MTELHVRRLQGTADLPLPAYQTPTAAGLDLVARAFMVDGTEVATATLLPGVRVLVCTGIAVALPTEHVGLVCPRSGLALRQGLGVVNGPGVIDEDYRGEVGVILINHGDEPVTLHRGDRVAQMIVVPAPRIRVVEVTSLDETARGEGGFGSTGRRTGT